MKKLYICQFIFIDGTLSNFYGTYESKEDAIKYSLRQDFVIDKITKGVSITMIEASIIDPLICTQNSDFDVVYNNAEELLGIYFNFQKFVNQELKDDLEALVKKHFHKDVDIKLKT